MAEVRSIETSDLRSLARRAAWPGFDKGSDLKNGKETAKPGRWHESKRHGKLSAHDG